MVCLLRYSKILHYFTIFFLYTQSFPSICTQKRTTFSGKNVVRKKGEVSYLTLIIINLSLIFPMENFTEIMHFYVIFVDIPILFYTASMFFTCRFVSAGYIPSNRASGATSPLRRFGRYTIMNRPTHRKAV